VFFVILALTIVRFQIMVLLESNSVLGVTEQQDTTRFLRAHMDGLAAAKGSTEICKTNPKDLIVLGSNDQADSER